MTRLAVRWLQSHVLVGTWLKIPSLMTLEAKVRAGFDFLIVDLEHSYVPTEWLHTACAVSQAHGVPVLVRLSDSSGRAASRVLDVGVDGVLFPQLRGVSEAESGLRSTVFPPGGTRGMGVTSRAGDWGGSSAGDYVRRGNQDLFRCIQFETRGTFEDLLRILSIVGRSGVFLGPSDLAHALEVPPTDHIVDESGTRPAREATAAGIPCGIAVTTVDQARVAAKRGYPLLAVSNDASVFASGISALPTHATAAVRG